MRHLSFLRFAAAEDTKKASDEKILIPVKYPEYADNLMSLAFLVRNQKVGLSAEEGWNLENITNFACC